MLQKRSRGTLSSENRLNCATFSVLELFFMKFCLEINFTTAKCPRQESKMNQLISNFNNSKFFLQIARTYWKECWSLTQITEYARLRHWDIVFLQTLSLSALDRNFSSNQFKARSYPLVEVALFFIRRIQIAENSYKTVHPLKRICQARTLRLKDFSIEEFERLLLTTILKSRSWIVK